MEMQGPLFIKQGKGIINGTKIESSFLSLAVSQGVMVLFICNLMTF